MKERPILMTPENAQKCHVGTKTQTRRIVKGDLAKFIQDFAGDPSDPSPLHFEFVKDQERLDDETAKTYRYTGMLLSLEEYPEEGSVELPCPYGGPGDRIWIREALYRRDDVMTYVDGSEVTQDGLVMPSWGEKKAIPSIHMPRWACRTVVEITEIRVQRIQEISMGDVIAEGVQCESYTGPPYCTWCSGHEVPCHQGEFEKLWQSINGPDSWEQNQWVWVISFRKVPA